jgi:hypothetical protein
LIWIDFIVVTRRRQGLARHARARYLEGALKSFSFQAGVVTRRPFFLGYAADGVAVFVVNQAMIDSDRWMTLPGIAEAILDALRLPGGHAIGEPRHDFSTTPGDPPVEAGVANLKSLGKLALPFEPPSGRWMQAR